MPEVVEYNQVIQQAQQDPTVVKSPQRTASIRASSMPRLAVDPQVMKSNTLFFSPMWKPEALGMLVFVVWLHQIKKSLACKGNHTPYRQHRRYLQDWFFWLFCNACSRGFQQTASWWNAPSPPSEISARTASGRSSTLWRGSVRMTRSEPGRGATEVNETTPPVVCFVVLNFIFLKEKYQGTKLGRMHKFSYL